MKKLIHVLIAVSLSLIICFCLVGCDALSNSTSDKNPPRDETSSVVIDKQPVNSSGKIVAYQGAQQENEQTFANAINMDNEYFFYYFYLGTISKVPLYTSVALEYKYDTEVTFSFNKLTSESLSNSISKSTATVDTYSDTVGAKISLKQEFDLKVGKILVKAKTKLSATEEVENKWTKNWGSTTTDSESVVSSYLTQYSEGYSEKTSFSEKSGFKKGNYYRMSFYNTVSAYGVLAYEVETNTYSTTKDFFLKENSTTRVWEESLDEKFEYEQSKDIVFDVSKAIEYAETHKLELNPIDKPEMPEDKFNWDDKAVISNAQLEADLYCENTYMNKLTFDVIGQLVNYNGKEYIYGNATYSGNVGAKRFNDVANMYLKNSNRSILFGGAMHWRGSYSDNNESGVAMHNGIAGKSITYCVEDPGKDFAGDEDNTIYLSGIIMETGNDLSNELKYPELISTTIGAELYTEGTPQDYLLFNVVGVKTILDDDICVNGFAYLNKDIAGSRFNDVANIKLKNPTKEIVYGGLLYWRGSESDNNESGISTYTEKDGDYYCYTAEDPGKDFAGNENNIIVINNICIKTGEKATVVSDDSYIPKIATSSFSSSIKAESTYEGRPLFNVIGFLTQYNKSDYIIGQATYYGAVGGARFNDVASFTFSDVTTDVLSGGSISWFGSYSDNNESGIGAQYRLIDNNYLEYMPEDPGKDFAFNESTKIIISNIIIEK